MKDDDKCQRCGAPEGGDLRTLWMACFYAMKELGLPFEELKIQGKLHEQTGEREACGIMFPEFNKKPINESFSQSFFTLRVCKDCRAEWMGAIKDWFTNVKKEEESPGTGIFVRKNGATVEITEEEWYATHEGEPVRFKKE